MSYIIDFKLAQANSREIFDGELTPKFELDTTYGTSLSGPRRAINDLLAMNFDSPHDMDDNCFWAVALVSVGLIQFQIPHAVTIGDVEYQDGRRYTNATRDSLLADITTGFNPHFNKDRPALPKVNAHCWITLLDGTVLDPTISVHIDQLTQTPSTATQSFNLAVFSSSTRDPRVGQHIPLFTGLTYHMKVVTGFSQKLSTGDRFLDHYQEWQRAYGELMIQRA